MTGHLLQKGATASMSVPPDSNVTSTPPVERGSPAPAVRRAQWFVRLRWIACAVSVLLTFVTIRALHYLDETVLVPLLVLCAALVATNVGYAWLLRTGRPPRMFVEFQIAVDLVLLTGMLHYSGGIENPLSFAYLFHVILSAILLARRRSFVVAGAAFGMYATMALGELHGVVGHYTLRIFPHDAAAGAASTGPDGATDVGLEHGGGRHGSDEAGREPERDGHEPAASDTGTRRAGGEHPAGHGHGHAPGLLVHAAHYPVYVYSMCGLMLVLLTLTAHFVSSIMSDLRAEESRRREEHERLLLVLDGTGAGLVVRDADLAPVWWNQRAAQWVTSFRDRDAPGDVRAVLEAVLNDGRVREFRRTVSDGTATPRVLHVTAGRVGEGGRATRVVELLQDVTERHALEARIVHAERMISVGGMAAGLAHEIGNPLASIATRLHRMKESADRDFVSRSVDLLLGEIARIERIVRGVSQFGRPSRMQWQPLDVNDVVRETVEMLRLHPGAKNVTFDVHLRDDLPRTMGVADQVKQALLNVGINALQAIDGAGHVTIESRREGGDIVVDVRDDGPGMDAGTRERVFEPFFTTRQKGSGLGMFVVHHVVRAHGGRVHVDSAPGRGCTVRIALPLIAVQPGAAGEEGNGT